MGTFINRHLIWWLTTARELGLGLQKAVQQFLRKATQSTLESLDFCSESSMFSVRSSSLNALAAVSEAIFAIAAAAKSKSSS